MPVRTRLSHSRCGHISVKWSLLSAICTQVLALQPPISAAFSRATSRARTRLLDMSLLAVPASLPPPKASTLIRSRLFFYNRDHSHDSSGGWDFVISDLAEDAARPNAWPGHKIHCLCLRSTFCVADKLQCKLFWHDVLVVDDSTAVGCHKLVLKQCRVVQSAALEASVCACVGKRQIRWLHICGDCGPDQVGFRLGRARAFRLCTYGLVTGVPCLAHKDHLAASMVLGTIDRVLKLWGIQWCFFLALVQLCNLA